MKTIKHLEISISIEKLTKNSKDELQMCVHFGKNDKYFCQNWKTGAESKFFNNIKWDIGMIHILC